MNRRSFLASSMAASALPVASLGLQDSSARRQFKLNYAPHLGMFKEHAPDPMEQIKFMADQGFRALEDNGMPRRSVAMQEKIRAELDRHGMQMGVFVASANFGAVTFASDKKANRDQIEKEMRSAVEIAKRVGARWCTVVPGRSDPGLEWDYQTSLVIDNLRRACEICEDSGLIMVLEPLNPWRDHPGLFLQKAPQTYMICRAVNHPSCKILFDIYHQQITEGNLIPNIQRCWDEIAYFQAGDNPGRKEPTTGEINYLNVFRHIHQRGFKGIVGMEHGNSLPGKEGELAVIRAYRSCDQFE